MLRLVSGKKKNGPEWSRFALRRYLSVYARMFRMEFMAPWCMEFKTLDSACCICCSFCIKFFNSSIFN